MSGFPLPERLDSSPLAPAFSPSASDFADPGPAGAEELLGWHVNRGPDQAADFYPADTFATRVSAPVLQELELPSSGDVTVNDAFKPLSRYFDRVWRPEQLPAALLGAMRVLTDPVETGTATVSPSRSRRACAER